MTLAASGRRRARRGDGTAPGVRRLSPLRAAGLVLFPLPPPHHLFAGVRSRASSATGASGGATTPTDARRGGRSCRSTAPLPGGSPPPRDASGSTNGGSRARAAGDRHPCVRSVEPLGVSGGVGAQVPDGEPEGLSLRVRDLPRSSAVAPGPTRVPQAPRSRTTSTAAPAAGGLLRLTLIALLRGSNHQPRRACHGSRG